MSTALSIVEATERILAGPAPVLFLDTCAVLDVLRVASDRDSTPDRLIPAAQEVATRAYPPGHKLWLIASDLIDLEWRDNFQTVLANAEAHIARTDRSLATLHAAIRVTSSIVSEVGKSNHGFAGT